MPVDPPQLPKPTVMVIKNNLKEDILVINDISKENILFRLLVWGIIKLMS